MLSKCAAPLPMLAEKESDGFKSLVPSKKRLSKYGALALKPLSKE